MLQSTIWRLHGQVGSRNQNSQERDAEKIPRLLRPDFATSPKPGSAPKIPTHLGTLPAAPFRHGCMYTLGGFVGYSYLAGAGSGRSELAVSTMIFQAPSACFRRMVNHLPRSDTIFLVTGSVEVPE